LQEIELLVKWLVGGWPEWVAKWVVASRCGYDGDCLINLLRTWLVGGFVGRRLFRAWKAYPYPVVACA